MDCHPYFDDLIIAREAEEDHDQILKQVFDHARQFNVRFNKVKLQYKKLSVHFLGVILD